MQSANFQSAVLNDLLLTDLKNEKPLLNVLMGSAASQDVMARIRAISTAGGFASSVTIPLLKTQALSPTDAYGTFSSLPSSTEDPTLAASDYAALDDYDVHLAVNRFILGANYISTIHQAAHAAGSLLKNQAVINNRNRIGDLLEQGVVADMISSTVYESVSSGAGVKFALDFSSEANLLTDLAQLHGEFSRQNVPLDKRWLCLPAVREAHMPVRYGGFSSRDYDVGGSRASGSIREVAGFKLIFSNNVGSSDAVAFNPDQYVTVMPLGVVVEELKDISKVGDFLRMYAVAGWGSISEISTAADGNSPTFNAQRRGVVACSVSG